MPTTTQKSTTQSDIPTVDQCNAAIHLGYVLNDRNKNLCRRAVSSINSVPWLWTHETIPQVLGLAAPSNANLTDEENTAALRFCETCEDGEGHDIPKPMMKRLAALGLVVHKGFGVYEGTPALNELQGSN